MLRLDPWEPLVRLEVASGVVGDQAKASGDAAVKFGSKSCQSSCRPSGRSGGAPLASRPTSSIAVHWPTGSGCTIARIEMVHCARADGTAMALSNPSEHNALCEILRIRSFSLPLTSTR